MYPIAVIPFTYATSFFFNTEMAGQGFTVFFNLISMSICPVAIFYLKLSEEYGHLGDRYGFFLRVLPSYSLSNALLFSGSGAQIIKTRQEYLERGVELEGSEDNTLFSDYYFSVDPWGGANLKGDFIAMVLHGILGVLLILLFEGLLCKSCWSVCF
jgi:hypothetical protein